MPWPTGFDDGFLARPDAEEGVVAQRGIERFERRDFRRREEPARDIHRVAHGAVLLDVDAEFAIAREREQQPLAGMREVEAQDSARSCRMASVRWRWTSGLPNSPLTNATSRGANAEMMSEERAEQEPSVQKALAIGFLPETRGALAFVRGDDLGDRRRRPRARVPRDPRARATPALHRRRSGAIGRAGVQVRWRVASGCNITLMTLRRAFLALSLVAVAAPAAASPSQSAPPSHAPALDPRPPAPATTRTAPAPTRCVRADDVACRSGCDRVRRQRRSRRGRCRRSEAVEVCHRFRPGRRRAGQEPTRSISASRSRWRRDHPVPLTKVLLPGTYVAHVRAIGRGLQTTTVTVGPFVITEKIGKTKAEYDKELRAPTRAQDASGQADTRSRKPPQTPPVPQPAADSRRRQRRQRRQGKSEARAARAASGRSSTRRSSADSSDA